MWIIISTVLIISGICRNDVPYVGSDVFRFAQNDVAGFTSNDVMFALYQRSGIINVSDIISAATSFAAGKHH